MERDEVEALYWLMLGLGDAPSIPDPMRRQVETLRAKLTPEEIREVVGRIAKGAALPLVQGSPTL